jgi:hypothetical protein
MIPEARFITSTSASGLHAAACLLAGTTPLDPRLAAAPVAAEAAALGADLAAIGLDRSAFFEHAIPLAVRFDSSVQLAGVALTKLLGPRQTDAAATRLARRLQSLWAAVTDAVPDGLDELELRSRPLREQWEARGGGLLAVVRRLTEPDVVVDEADVILVQPVWGGSGSAHPLYNALALEAVLVNADAALPEVARLGWLWAQLNLDLPKFQDSLGRDAMAVVGPLAVLPAVLAAAQEVELVKFDRQTLETALAAWRGGPMHIERKVDVDGLLGWWETYQASNPSWTVALAALGQMLADE